MKIALLGAESTGKTVLSQALVRRLEKATGQRCVAVPEYLREWCDLERRTPRAEEQRAIAQAHGARLAAAAESHDIVVADTTPLMVAVYSDLLFADRSLYPMALEIQRGFDLTLLTALDLPWVADSMRDGPHVRAPVDGAVRSALRSAGIGWSVIAGHGADRVDAALDAIAFAMRKARPERAGLFTGLSARHAGLAARAWVCRDCDDPDCERLAHRRAQRSGA